MGSSEVPEASLSRRIVLMCLEVLTLLNTVFFQGSDEGSRFMSPDCWQPLVKVSLVLKVLEVFLHVVVEAPDSLEVLKEVLEVIVRFQ